MLVKTKGIVLRTVKYGETSLIASVFTEEIGLQSYMLKGVRGTKAKSQKAQLFFSASILEMVVYYQPQRNLQMTKEFQPAIFYQTLTESIIKNSIALFAMEVLSQILIEEDEQKELFHFVLHFLQVTDQLEKNQLANLPLYFLIQVGKISGYFLAGTYSEATPYLDLSEGRFSDREAVYPPYIEVQDAFIISQLKDASSIEDIISIQLKNELRKRILDYLLVFFQNHIPHFRQMKTVAILSAILN